MSRKLTLEEFKQKLFNVHGKIILLDEPSYVDTCTKCRFFDIEFGELWNTPNNITSKKQGHPKRKLVNFKETCLKKYGTMYPPKFFFKKPKISVEEIKRRIFEKHGNIVTLDENTYINTSTKCRFIDKDFGDWWTKPANVYFQGKNHPKRSAEKIKKTCIEKYGVDNPAKNEIVKNKIKESCLKNFGVNNPSKSLEIKEKKKRTLFANYGIDNPMHSRDLALKNAKSQRYTCKLFHWKTNEELVCVGSYEKKVVEWLNKNKIDFRWQSQVFKMPNGKTYRPDLYLIKEDKWIEVKGYFRKDAKEKWDWFHKEYSNSELWDNPTLITLSVL